MPPPTLNSEEPLNRISIGDERLHLCARRSTRLNIHVLSKTCGSWSRRSPRDEWRDQSSQATGP